MYDYFPNKYIFSKFYHHLLFYSQGLLLLGQRIWLILMGLWGRDVIPVAPVTNMV